MMRLKMALENDLRIKVIGAIGKRTSGTSLKKSTASRGAVNPPAKCPKPVRVRNPPGLKKKAGCVGARLLFLAPVGCFFCRGRSGPCPPSEGIELKYISPEEFAKLPAGAAPSPCDGAGDGTGDGAGGDAVTVSRFESVRIC